MSILVSQSPTASSPAPIASPHPTACHSPPTGFPSPSLLPPGSPLLIPPPVPEKEDQIYFQIGNMLQPPLPKPKEVWRGRINVFKTVSIPITAYEISGDCSNLDQIISANLDVVGTICPKIVWDYISNMKNTNKIVSLIQLSATEHKLRYRSFYNFINNKNCLGIARNFKITPQFIYIYPLGSHKPIPQALLPIKGPGLEESRPTCLMGIIIREKQRHLNRYPISVTSIDCSPPPTLSPLPKRPILPKPKNKKEINSTISRNTPPFPSKRTEIWRGIITLSDGFLAPTIAHPVSDSQSNYNENIVSANVRQNTIPASKSQHDVDIMQLLDRIKSIPSATIPLDLSTDITETIPLIIPKRLIKHEEIPLKHPTKPVTTPLY